MPIFNIFNRNIICQHQQNPSGVRRNNGTPFCWMISHENRRRPVDGWVFVQPIWDLPRSGFVVDIPRSGNPKKDREGSLNW